MASDSPGLVRDRPAPPHPEAQGRGARDRAIILDRDLSWRASNHLLTAHPELSAGARLWSWQRRAGAAVVMLTVAGALAAPAATMTVLFVLMSLPFLFIIGLRLVALSTLASRRPAAAEASAGARNAGESGQLPRYSVLVPLYQEAHVVPGLVAALAALDYPADRLEILLITERADGATEAAIRAARLPRHVRMVVVPDGHPRTKPRALNYALAGSSGDFVAVYDAEDTPHPAQLLAALALLRDRGERVGCVQARLAIDNAERSLLTRQFAIEYAALFGAILPALESLEFPVPLGGTSNHFPRHVLDEVGGWDPYNVTEDADLGIRLARYGYTVRMLASDTREEAPETAIAWRNQRTRWLKGWMQTWLVHMREPRRLWREVGARRFLGFQMLMGGMILSALVHPWFYALAGAQAAGLFDPWASGPFRADVVWWAGVLNLMAGYVSAVTLGWAAASRHGIRHVAPHAVLMPFYWLAVSFAAYRALWQLARDPYRWEKTRHGARPGPGRAGA